MQNKILKEINQSLKSIANSQKLVTAMLLDLEGYDLSSIMDYADAIDEAMSSPIHVKAEGKVIFFKHKTRKLKERERKEKNESKRKKRSKRNTNKS